MHNISLKKKSNEFKDVFEQVKNQQRAKNFIKRMDTIKTKQGAFGSQNPDKVLHTDEELVEEVAQLGIILGNLSYKQPRFMDVCSLQTIRADYLIAKAWYLQMKREK